jgi:hypothetical protein
MSHEALLLVSMSKGRLDSRKLQHAWEKRHAYVDTILVTKSQGKNHMEDVIVDGTSIKTDPTERLRLKVNWIVCSAHGPMAGF